MPRPLELPLNRYWVPTGPSEVDVYPFDLGDESWYRLVIRPTAVPLSELADVPCLFLLGKPGLGKSTAIRQEVNRLHSVAPASVIVHAANLAEVSSDSGLDDLFRVPIITSWCANSSILQLFLDSYDESLRRYPTLKRRLLARLRDLPLDRLQLRVACRSGELPANLPDELAGLWHELAPDIDYPVRVVRLEPLGLWDVRKWAEAKGVDATAFIAEVDARNGRAFAGRPVTLGPLLSRFKSAEWPATEVDLFAAACLDLCAEPDPNRRDGPRLTRDQRLAVAERIAALMTLANLDFVGLDHLTELPEGALSAGALAGGEEEVGGIAFPADDRAVEEVVEGTALFEVEDAGLVRWSHQAHREFLAARFFARRLNDAANAVPFLEHAGRPGSTDRFIAPQLAETAAWLAAMDEGVARWIAEHDPAVLLRTRHHVPPAVRPRLASWLLHEEANGRSVGMVRRADEARDALLHSGLCDKLRTFVEATAFADEGRSLACQLAAACGCTDLEEELLAVSLNDCEPLLVRWSAVSALAEVGSDDARGQLLPLLRDVDGASVEADRLRAEVLGAVWPVCLSTSRMLDYLCEHQRTFSDEFSGAFGRRLVNRLGQGHLVEALEWMAANASQPEGPLDFHLGEIVAAAGGHLGDEAVRSALAAVIVARLEAVQEPVPGRDSSFLNEVCQQPTSAILAFFDDLVARIRSPLEHWDLHGMAVDLDLPYSDLAERAATGDPHAAPFWRRIVERHPKTWEDAQGLETLRQAVARVVDNPDAADWLNALVARAATPSAPSSQGTHPSTTTLPSRPTRQDQVAACLAWNDWDIAEAWVNVGRRLNLNEAGDTWILEYDLVDTPGWQEATDSRREEVVKLALDFLELAPSEHPRVEARHIATAGYQATALLAETDPARLARLPGDAWQRWLPALAEIATGTSHRQPFAAVVAEAYQSHPSAVRDALRNLLASDATPSPAGALFEALDPLWDVPLSDAVAEHLSDLELPVASQAECLAALLRHRDPRGDEIAVGWILEHGEDSSRAVTAAKTVMIAGSREVIAQLVALLDRAGVDFVRDVLQAVAATADPFADASQVSSRLPELTLADLYRVAARAFPPEQDVELAPGEAPWSNPRAMAE